jgi:hypothetical protein
METQIKILRRIAHGLNEQLQYMQSQVLSQLEGKLKTANLTVDQLLTQKRENEKSRSSMGAKASGKAKRKSQFQMLWQIVEEIEKWQARYDPSWVLIMQLSIGIIDSELDGELGKPKTEQIPLIMAAKGSKC